MKNLKLIYLTLTLAGLLLSPALFAQNAEDAMTQMLKNSHPGHNHAVLAKLEGAWNFQDAKLSFVKGTINRKPIYDGRFYTVEIKGGKLDLPVADGKMKKDNYQELQIEGYDNVKMKFVRVVLNNHIGSDIQYQTGSYDSVKKEFRYEWESELIKGRVSHNRMVVVIVDSTHYNENFYALENSKYVKVRELKYSKSE